jgi:diadenosine tetraphosphate (Ap4A) HIT family hydrolase
MAILDHRPTRKGHSLIIPKIHVDQFIDLNDELAAHIVKIGNRLARKIMSEIKPQSKRIGFVVHGYIPHAHYHVIPQHEETDIISGLSAKIENDAVVFDDSLIPLATEEEQSETLSSLILSKK